MNIALKIIAGIVAFLLLAVASVAIYWVAGDKSSWRDELARLASEQLGRTLVIKGDLSPSLSVTRGLVLQVHDLELANAEGFQPPVMVSVPQLDIGIDVRALFSHVIHITGLDVTGATVNLESRGTTNNWTFTKRVPDQPVPETDEPAVKTADGKVLAFAADDVTVTDLMVVSRDRGAVKNYRVSELKLAAPADGSLTISVAVDADGQPLQISAAAESLDQLRRGLKQQVTADIAAGGRTVQLAAVYSRHQDQHLFDDLRVTIDQLQATGNLSLSLAADVPQVNGRLTIPTIDSAWFASKSAGAAAGGKSKGAETAPLFSHAPLPWDLLKAANGNLRVDIGQIQKQGESWGPANVQASLNNGALSAVVIVQPPGAPQPVKVNIGASNRQANIAVDAPALDSSLWAQFLGDDPIILSPAAITLNAAGQGLSLHDIAASANGAFSFEAQPGKLKPSALPTTIRRVLDVTFTPAVMNEAALGCMKAHFTITNGVMKSDGVGTDSNIAAVAGEGRVSLGDETIKMRFVAVPKIPSLASLRLPITVEGPLASPGFGADTLGTAGQVAGKVASAVLGARFGDFASKAVDDSTQKLVSMPPNPCVVAATTAPVPDKTTTPTGIADILPPEVVQDVKKAQERAMNFMKDPLTKLMGKRKAEPSGAVPVPEPVQEESTPEAVTPTP